MITPGKQLIHYKEFISTKEYFRVPILGICDSDGLALGAHVQDVE